MFLTNKKRTEITVETHQVPIIRRSSAAMIYCEICQTNVQILEPAQIISIFGFELAEIKQFFQNNQIHLVCWTEMVCGNSFAAYFNTNKTNNKKGEQNNEN
ncbi:MAG: hypothetical protein LC768_15070 [Acidobacteria bacterium]|nr:hypothetical protein [Acidobacteriota bacterium]MCA1639628.1 hypothetical protein [Acidobacteriota bacterium]